MLIDVSPEKAELNSVLIAAPLVDTVARLELSRTPPAAATERFVLSVTSPACTEEMFATPVENDPLIAVRPEVAITNEDSVVDTSTATVDWLRVADEIEALISVLTPSTVAIDRFVEMLIALADNTAAIAGVAACSVTKVG